MAISSNNNNNANNMESFCTEEEPPTTKVPRKSITKKQWTLGYPDWLGNIFYCIIETKDNLQK